ncbi:MAG: flagellar basal body P-ring formation chaperone FlgA [Alphaproteobacteria bacterium]|nr:flagellar basal body P-ring formation chaperone FlgA [Alphaproteobacteria bacterium]
MRKLRLGFLVVAIYACVGAGAAFAASSLRPVVEVDRQVVRLGDVFSSVPDGVDLDIAMAPAPGKRVTYDVNVLNRLSQQYGLGWQPQSMADKCVIVRASTKITQDAIRLAVLEKIKDESKTTEGNQVEVNFDNRNLEIHLPVGQAPDFVLNNFTYDAQNQRFRAELVAGAGPAPLVQTVAGRISLKKSVPVLSRRLEAGTVISAADLSLMNIAAEHLSNDMFTSQDGLVGKELRRDTAEGQVLRTRDVIQPRMVTRGSLVLMKVETPFMQISTQGKSLQDGSMGDTVRVTNVKSNRVIEGVVVSPGVIKVEVGSLSSPQHAAVEDDNLAQRNSAGF